MSKSSRDQQKAIQLLGIEIGQARYVYECARALVIAASKLDPDLGLEGDVSIISAAADSAIGAARRNYDYLSGLAEQAAGGPS